MTDLVVEGRLFYGGSLTNGCIAIKDGKIVKVAKTILANDKLDVGRQIIIPGGVDLHVHFRQPGMTHKEDFIHGSTAAACGGTTFYLDMPNTKPHTSSMETFEKKISLAKDSVVDYGIAALLGPESPPELGHKTTAWKWYYGASTNATCWTDVGAAKDLLEKSPGFTTVHCEDPEKVAGGGKNLEEHSKNRPEQGEINAISSIAAGGLFGLNVAHCSSARVLAAAKKCGYSREITLHHLLLDTSSHLGAYAKVNPPLRKKADRAALLEAFLMDDAVLATDHAPHTIDEKEGAFEEAPAGIPGVEERLPVLMAMVKKGDVPIEKLVSSCCELPGRRLGLTKGRIAEGCDADLAIFNPLEMEKLRGANLHSKCMWSAYEGQDVIFPSYVFCRGEAVVDASAFVGERGQGRYVGHAVPPEEERP